MKKSILSLVVLCLIQFVNAQDRKVKNIVDSTSVILEYNRNGGVKVDLFDEDMWTNKLHHLLKLNVCEYYDLKDYDTDLKRKVFKESSEGANLLKSMRMLRQKVMNSKGYYLFNFKDNWGWYKGYDLQKKQFVLTYIIRDSEYSTIPGYIALPEALIKMNPQIRQFKEERKDAMLVDIRFPLLNEKVALNMEDNIENLVLVVEFKIQDSKVRNQAVKFLNLPVYSIMGLATKLYIVDKNTHEIYFSM